MVLWHVTPTLIVGAVGIVRNRDRRSPGQRVEAAIVGPVSGTVTAARTLDPKSYPFASPWTSNDLERLVFEDLFGPGITVTSREAAMRLPAAARARNLVVSAISRLPLVALTAGTRTPTQPTWLYRTDDGTSPQLRLAWTVDDLIWHGFSAWWKVRAADGFPAAVGRINFDEWEFDGDGGVLVNGAPPVGYDVVIIPGLHEGVLCYGAGALTDAATLYQNVRARLQNPVPLLNLHQTGGDPLNPTQIDALIQRWAAARSGTNAGVSFTNESLELQELGSGGEQLMIEARNAAALDLARVIGVSGSKIDATVDKASLNYETTSGRNREFLDFDLELYMLPIEARLSLDDMVPLGTSIGFDTGEFSTLTPPATPARED